WLKKGPNPEVCPQRKSVVDTFLRLEDALMRLSHLLAVDAVRRLREDAAVCKQKGGVIGYDDMLERVHAALCGDRAPQLLETLRQRYRIAFVDEFQDTDPIQWRIFRRLFLEDSETGSDSRLMLIGDPKQAIYSFRGADVYAYLEARNEMERLAAEGRARLYSLATNFRSQPELVSLFNRLFGRNEWFSAERRSGPFDIEYRASASPGEDDLSLVSAQDRSGRASLNLVDLRGPSSPRSAKPVLARFVAAEILRLTRDRVLEIQPKGGERRSLHFGDICILVRSRSEAFLVEMELADRGIPYSFYKKPGLFQSEEALYLSMVFRAVADPGSLPDLKKAMLTPFFGLSPADLMEVENLSTDHPVRRLVHGWYELAAHRRWGRLFQSLIEDSGLLFRTAASRYRDRILTNYRQIFEHLTDEAYRKNLDFRGLSSRLDADRNQSAGTRDDVDIHQIETDEPRVQIMTLHVSKGLQFPVVFVAGGLTRPPEDPVHVYHVVDGSRPQAGVRRVIDLSRRSNRERHLRERDEEDKRLYYVALTRAQCKLYVPFFPLASEHAWVGPASRFLPVALAAAFTGSSPPAGVEWCSPDFSGDSGSKREADGPAAEDAAENGGIPDPLLPPEDDFRSRSIRLDSFSSLHGTLSPGFAAGADRAGFRADRDRGKEEDEGLLPRKPQPAWDLHPEEQMPGGTEVGSMFHDILERIDYAAVLERPGDLLDMPETAERIAQAMEAYRIDPRWRNQVCRVVADALTAPIRGVGKTFRLGALSERDRIHEVEFTYSRTVSPGSSRSEPECATSSGPCGFVRGFVDLVFRHDGRFFIADWKSNRIDDGYRPTVVAAHMNEAGYVLQYKLYTVAVLRWLRQTLGRRFDPDTHFGGVFYFFIRGMGAGDGSGIHYVPPEEIGPGDRLEAEIAAVLAGAGRS
ncbi:MAG: UvrD-helicase domain-containing protein, partial [Desulfobacteraceae bacterium]|nr:UvrD-helicase domain-containing protein [Desulfobacteraceae bacterium]